MLKFSKETDKGKKICLSSKLQTKFVVSFYLHYRLQGHPTDRFGKLSVRKAFLKSPLIFLREFSPRIFVIWEI